MKPRARATEARGCHALVGVLVLGLAIAHPAGGSDSATTPDLMESILVPNGLARLVELTCAVTVTNQSQVAADKFVFRATIPPSGLPYQRARMLPVPGCSTRSHENGVDRFVEFHFPVPSSSRMIREIVFHVLLLPVDFGHQKVFAHGRDTRLAPYLSPERFIESDAPEIIAAANGIFYGKATDLEKAGVAYGYPARTIRFRPGEPIGALGALRSRLGDCTEFAALFCALCRAGGVPARITSVFNMDSAAEMTSDQPNHNAAEAYIASWGWVPVDPNLGQGRFDLGVGFAKTSNSVILLARAGAWVWSTWLPPDGCANGVSQPVIRAEVFWRMRVIGEGPSPQMLRRFQETSNREQ